MNGIACQNGIVWLNAMQIMQQKYMKVPPFDKSKLGISTNEKAGFHTLNQ